LYDDIKVIFHIFLDFCLTFYASIIGVSSHS